MVGLPADMVCRDSCLLICRACKRGQSGLLRHVVSDRDRISHGVDIGIGGLHVIIDHDAVLRTERKPGLSSQMRFRHNADRQDDQIGSDTLPCIQRSRKSVFRSCDCLHACIYAHMDPAPIQLRMHQHRHIVIQRHEHMLRTLQDRDIDAFADQVLRHLQADETAAGDHSLLRCMILDVFPYGQCILDVAHGEYARSAHICPLRNDRLRTRGQDQFIVFLFIRRPGLKIFYNDCFTLRADRDRLR